MVAGRTTISTARYAKADVRAAAVCRRGADTPGEPVLVPVVTAVFKYYYQGPAEVLDTYGTCAPDRPGRGRRLRAERVGGRGAAWLVLGRARRGISIPRAYLPMALARTGHLRRAHAGSAGVAVYRLGTRTDAPAQDAMST